MTRRLALLPFVVVALALLPACSSGGDDAPGGAGGRAGQGGAGGAGGEGGGTGGSGGDGGSGGGGSGGDVPSEVRVEGKVVDGEGRPVDGARVALNGAYDDAVTTGADGAFALGDVQTPYDLAVVVSGALYELRGLTRANPVVPAASEWKVVRQATISGEVAGLDGPLPADEKILIGFGDDATAIVADQPGFQGAVQWRGSAEKTFEVSAFHVRTDSQGGYEILAAGTMGPLAVEAGMSVDDLSIVLGPVLPETSETSVVIDIGAYDNFSVAGVAFFELDQTRVRLRGAEWMPSHATLRFPGAAAISLRATDAKENLAIRVAPVVPEGMTPIVLPATLALEAIEPRFDATGVSTTPVLKWTSVPGAKSYWVNVGMMAFVLPATETSLEIPDTGDLRVRLPAGEGMGWQVHAFLDAGFAANDMTDGSGMGLDRTFFADELTVYRTGLSWFRTAP